MTLVYADDHHSSHLRLVSRDLVGGRCEVSPTSRHSLGPHLETILGLFREAGDNLVDGEVVIDDIVFQDNVNDDGIDN